MKVCRICEKEKLLEDFGKHSHSSDGFDNRCRDCMAEDKRTRYRLMKENKHSRTEVCEMCGKKSSKTLTLDHDHDTKLFRGWLCDDCNVGIGRLGDRREGAENAVRYFDKVEARNDRLFKIN